MSGTQLGVADQTGCSISTVSGKAAAGCAAWFDYRTQVAVASPVAVSGTEQWVESGGANFTQTTGSNQYTVTFVDQFQVSLTESPPGSGEHEPIGFEGLGELRTTINIRNSERRLSLQHLVCQRRSSNHVYVCGKSLDECDNPRSWKHYRHFLSSCDPTDNPRPGRTWRHARQLHSIRLFGLSDSPTWGR